MSKLTDIRSSLKELELLGLPVSSEQKLHLADAENEFIQEEIIPKIKEIIQGLFDEIDFKTKIAIEYDGNLSDGVHVYLLEEDKHKVQSATFPNKNTLQNTGNRKKWFLRVTYPDGNQQTGRGIDILKQVVNYVGPQKIHDMQLKMRGIQLVEKKYIAGFERFQTPLNNGYFLMVNSNNHQKKMQIEEISRRLQLKYKVDIIDENGNVQI